jgi:hypothetical protein
VAATTQVRLLVWTFVRDTVGVGVAEFRLSWRPLYPFVQCTATQGPCNLSGQGAEVATHVMKCEHTLCVNDPRKSLASLAQLVRA